MIRYYRMVLEDFEIEYQQCEIEAKPFLTKLKPLLLTRDY